MAFGKKTPPEDDFGGDDADRELEAQERQKLQNLTAEDMLRIAHEEQIRTLCAKARAGTITYQEMTVLRNMLRDNGMVLGIKPDTPAPTPTEAAPLPDFEDPEEEL